MIFNFKAEADDSNDGRKSDEGEFVGPGGHSCQDGYLDGHTHDQGLRHTFF